MVALMAHLLFTACGRDDRVVYADYVDIPTEGWSRKEFCSFETASIDSTLFDNPQGRYNVILSIRHTGECPYAELFLPAVQSVDSCTALPDTLHVRLSGGDGAWRGTHSKGIYTLTDTLLTHTPLPPRYSLRLYQAMPPERLTGLLSVGLIIETAD